MQMELESGRDRADFLESHVYKRDVTLIQLCYNLSRIYKENNVGFNNYVTEIKPCTKQKQRIYSITAVSAVL